MKKYFASVLYRETGRQHLEAGKGCEDAVSSCYAKETGVQAISLSDGAGSYENAALGAELTAKTAAAFLAEKFELLYELDEETAAAFLLKKVRTPLEAEAAKSGKDLLSYSATLLCAALHPDGRFLVFHVGDGAVVGYSPKAGCKTVSVYEHQGPVNQTTFVTVDDTDYQFYRGRGEYAAFVLMSDGPEEFLANAQQVHSRVKLMIQLAYFVSEENMQEQLESLVGLLKQKGMRDDASFALLLDTQKTAAVFAGLSPQMKQMLFGVEELGTKKLKQSVEILDTITAYPNGATVSQIARQLYFHSPKIAKKKMQFMLDMNLIEWANGRYYLSK